DDGTSCQRETVSVSIMRADEGFCCRFLARFCFFKLLVLVPREICFRAPSRCDGSVSADSFCNARACVTGASFGLLSSATANAGDGSGSAGSSDLMATGRQTNCKGVRTMA